MIAVCVVAQQDLNVGELEPQLLDRLLNRCYIPLIRAVDEYISLRCNDQEGTQGSGPDVVDVANDLVGWELRRLILRRAHVACQYRPRRIGIPLNCDGRMVRCGLPRSLSLACVRAQTEDQRRDDTREYLRPGILLHC